MRRIEQSVSLVQLQLGEGPGSPGTGRQRSSCCNLRILHNWHNIGQMHRFDPTWPRHGLNFRPTWTHLAPTSDPGPMLQTPCDALKTSTFGSYYQRFLPCMGVRARSCCPDWACLGPTSAPVAPTQDQVAHVKPNLRPNVPKLRHVGPQLLEPDAKFSASSAQVRLNLRPRTAKLDPSQLWLGQVGLLLSPLCYSLGASRSDSKIKLVDSQFLTDFAA